MNTGAQMKGWKIGYIRTSTVHQNTDRQLDGFNLDKIYEERVSAKTTNRPKLLEMFEQIREGDEIFVHDISRLARNIEDLHKLVRIIIGKNCSIHFIKENLHFNGEKSDPTQELLLSMLGAVYQFERSIMLERQKEGIAKAKLRGAYKGRPRTVDQKKIISLLNEGYSMRKVAEITDTSLSTVTRAKKTFTTLVI